jgi:hypothetical protein
MVLYTLTSGWNPLCSRDWPYLKRLPERGSASIPYGCLKQEYTPNSGLEVLLFDVR